MKTTNIPLLVRSLTDVYAPAADDHATIEETAHEVLAAMVRAVLDVHEHELYGWDSGNARAIPTDELHEAVFAVCKMCGSIQREFFWCATVRQLYVTLADACDLEARPGVWRGWNDMAEAIKRARAAYPGPVATAVVRALNNPAYSLVYRDNLLDAVITCTQAVPAQPSQAEKGSR